MTLESKGKLLTIGLFLSALSIVAHAGDLEPWAPPGATMKTLSSIEPRRVIWAEMLPLVITEQGSSWYFAESISYDGVEHGITIDADDVTIDLNGSILRGNWASLVSDGIHVGANRYGTTILNGTIRRWGRDGINAEGAFETKVLGLTLDGNLRNGLSAGTQSLIADCRASYNSSRGIVAQDSSVIRDCIAVGNHIGFLVSGSSMRDSVAADNLNTGIWTNTASTVVRCRALGNGTDGILALFANTISDCVAKDNWGNGIQVNSGNYVLRNTFDLNGQATGDGAGIHVVGHSNRLESNNVLSNDRGIDVDLAGNLIVKNSARGNGTNYDIVGGNEVGPTGSAASATSPWANIEF